MKSIVTEEMRFRKRVCDYAIKHGNNALAARRYHTSRQQVYRWLQRYDGTAQSLGYRSRRPNTHPKEHSNEELDLIKKTYTRYGFEGLAQVYVACQKKGYDRSYGSMCKQIQKRYKKTPPKKDYPKSTWKAQEVTFPGEKVQIDIKYVPLECIGFNSHGIRYYQITAIDEYSRRRVLEIVDEKSVTHTSRFMKSLEGKMGFKIKTAQTDNGTEFTNSQDQKSRRSAFEAVLEKLGIKHLKTRPYSPWQNGKVERSHRIDGHMFYKRRRFKSYQQMITSHKRYMNRYNNIAKRVLGFKSPNEVVDAFDWSQLAG
ncbi:MAG: DDE-type integrase/transposase/recombinase [Euryarchaeota archaeon]|nr:DDE-type integrase/transposase/recombinase [Euryarchaeota archaeon]